jgi:hypothetical protein
MLRRPAAANLLPLRLVIDGAESVVYLRAPTSEDLAGLPDGIKAGLLGEAVAAVTPKPTVEDAVSEVVKPAAPVKPKPPEPEPLERVADTFMRRFGTQIGALLTDPDKITGLGAALLSTLGERGQAAAVAIATDEDAAARHLLVRCVQAQDDHEGRQVPLRLVTLAADEDADPVGCYWIGHFPSLRALWPALKEVVIKSTPSFRP